MNDHEEHMIPRPALPSAAAAAMNDAEEHLASQTGIPEVLRPALLQAEANCRVGAGTVMSIASIDHGRLCVKVPDYYEKQSLFEFLWASLVRSGGHSIQFAFAAQDESLRVIYMDKNNVGYVASAAIHGSTSGVRCGDWTVEQMPTA